MCANPFRDLPAGHVGHAEVGEDEIVCSVPCHLHPGQPARRGVDDVPLGAKNVADDLGDLRLVVDDQDASGAD